MDWPFGKTLANVILCVVYWKHPAHIKGISQCKVLKSAPNDLHVLNSRKKNINAYLYDPRTSQCPQIETDLQPIKL